MNNIILKSGEEFDITGSFESLDHLPIGNYNLLIGAFGRVYLQKTDEFTFPSKIYNNDLDFIDHVVSKFNNDPNKNNMGVLFKGGKGLGKTFTAKVLCKELNLPVIKITKNTGETDIFSFLNKIPNPYVVFIDEFEKLFSQSSNYDTIKEINQNSFLSFLDGINNSSTRKVFIITSNDRVNDYLINRPSRINYVKEYDKVSKELVIEVVDDLLKDKSFKDDLLANVALESLNLDILIKIIEEINIVNKPYSSFKSFFNFKVLSKEFNVYLIKNNSIGHSTSPREELLKKVTIYDSSFQHLLSGSVHELTINKNEIDYLFLTDLEEVIKEGFIFNAYYYSYDENEKEIKNNVKVKLVLLTKNLYSLLV